MQQPALGDFLNPRCLGNADCFPCVSFLVQLLAGEYTKEEQEPDADLGKSLRPGFRNEWHDPNRVFGLPSIRTDQPVPKQASIASTVNFGEEASARHLLFPARATHMGISENQYLEVQTRDGVAEYLKRAGIAVGEMEFEDIFSIAAEHDGQQDKCTMETYMKARHMMIARALGL